MKTSLWLSLVAAALVAAWLPTAAQAPGAPGQAVLYEGARLITADGSAPIEASAFLVQGGRFVRVGRKGEVQAPAGATRVDLTGKTVIPALVDAHSHIGYMRHLTSGPQNYTRENILDHMHRFAYFGVAASLAMGTDFGELPFQLRDELTAGKDPDAARFLTAGRGLAPLSEISPANMHHAAYAVTTVEGARADVEELALRKIPIIKMWVDTRGGAMKTLTPDLYGAILDEAHKRRMRVAVHATELPEAKNLLRAGIDVFAHMITDVDEELVSLFKQHPNTAVLTALSGPRRIVSAPWISPPHPLITETVRPEQITRLQDRLASQTPQAVQQGRDAWDRLARGIRTLSAAGVKFGVGTDGGGQTGDQFVGWTMHAELENLVAAGMTPAQVIQAATRNSAEILGLSDLGTVAAGKSADFVVLDANPLDDITNTRRISKVYLRGHEVDRAKLRAGWTASASASRSLDETLASAITRGDVPGLVAMATTRDRILYQGAFGKADVGRARPMTADALFRIASMTKAVTSVAAMQLYEEGRFALDDPAGKYLPELANMMVFESFDTSSGAYKVRPASKAITIRHLFTHTSGLGYAFTSPIVRDFKPREGETYEAGPLLFEPGTDWMYGTSTDWVGRLVEKLSGKNLEEYFRERIFAPLKMSDTFYNVPEAKQARLVTVHRRQDGRADAPLTEQPNQPQPPATTFVGGGGLSSTASDYIRFERMILNGGTLDGARILSADTVALMSKNHIGSVGVPAVKTAQPERSMDFTFINDRKDKWGLGFLVTTSHVAGKRSEGSLSWGGINNTYFWIDPARGIAGVIMMQLLPFADTKALAIYDTFERGVYQLADELR